MSDLAAQSPIGVFIVAPHRLSGSAMAVLLQTDPAFRLVGVVDILSVPLLNHWSDKPDLILVDIDRPAQPDWQLLSEVCWECRDIPVVALTFDEEVALSPRWQELGASFCLSKKLTPKELFEALRLAMNRHLSTIQSGLGQYVGHRGDMISLAPTIDSPHKQWRSLLSAIQLTEREREMFVLLAQGLRVRSIAEKLHLTEQTVRNYTSSIYAKLGVSSKAELVARYYQLARI